MSEDTKLNNNTVGGAWGKGNNTGYSSQIQVYDIQQVMLAIRC